MAETDVDKRAAMLNAIDMRRGSSAVSQQVQKTDLYALACLHTICQLGTLAVCVSCFTSSLSIGVPLQRRKALAMLSARLSLPCVAMLVLSRHA